MAYFKKGPSGQRGIGFAGFQLANTEKPPVTPAPLEDMPQSDKTTHKSSSRLKRFTS